MIENLRKYSQALFFENQIFKLRQTAQNHFFLLDSVEAATFWSLISPDIWKFDFIEVETEDVWKVEVFEEELEHKQKLYLSPTNPNS